MNKRILSLALTLIMLLALVPALPAVAYGDSANADSSYASIASASGRSYAIKKDSSLWAWGSNTGWVPSNWRHTATNTDFTLWYSFTSNYTYYGLLGINSSVEKYNTPQKIMDDVRAVSAGGYHTMVLKNDGSLWGWGYKFYRDLTTRSSSAPPAYSAVGTGSVSDVTTPVKVMDDVAAVSAGNTYTLAIKTDGSLWTWGYGEYGELGNGTVNSSATPMKIMDDVTTVSAVNDVNNHNLALKTDGTLWAWGYNSSGQVGDGTTAHRNTPVKVMDDVANLSAGGHYSLALKTDGSLWAWGSNYSGRLGDGTTDSRLSPVHIMDNVATVSAGSDHSLAVKTDGSLWAWGHNGEGRLGNGSVSHWDNAVYVNNDTYAPVKIMDNVAAISARGSHSLALKTDRTLWAWGYGQSGQLGNGTFTDSAVPIKVMIDNVRMPTDKPPVTVTFISNGGTAIESTKADYGGTLAPPTSPTKTDSTFLGWYTDAQFTTKFNFGADMVTEDTTLYAKWESTNLMVKFVTNAAADYPAVEMAQGALVTPPSIPTKAGYSFAGWYKDSALTAPWNFTTDKTTGASGATINIYGKWNVLPDSASKKASPTKSKVLVNGKVINFEAYAINGNNYFKLRDIAYALNGTEKSFGVTWDSFYNAISLKAGQRYSSVGGELAANANAVERNVNATTSTIYLNDQVIFMPAYNIGGNNYFKLRDLAVALNFGVGWDAATNTIAITSADHYTAG